VPQPTTPPPFARSDGIVLKEVDGTDPVLLHVRDLCYETLHLPFGVTRNDAWNETDPRSTHIVAMDGDALAGYVRLILEDGGGHVRQVTVARAYRGRGIASDLVTRAVAIARDMGLSFAFLNARARAVGLYARIGFRVTEGPFRMGRTYLPHVRMEMPLR
jgi:ribosomal protein S18 acetylase RimI-like enzyme